MNYQNNISSFYRNTTPNFKISRSEQHSFLMIEASNMMNNSDILSTTKNQFKKYLKPYLPVQLHIKRLTSHPIHSFLSNTPISNVSDTILSLLGNTVTQTISLTNKMASHFVVSCSGK